MPSYEGYKTGRDAIAGMPHEKPVPGNAKVSGLGSMENTKKTPPRRLRRGG